MYYFSEASFGFEPSEPRACLFKKRGQRAGKIFKDVDYWKPSLIIHILSSSPPRSPIGLSLLQTRDLSAYIIEMISSFIHKPVNGVLFIMSSRLLLLLVRSFVHLFGSSMATVELDAPSGKANFWVLNHHKNYISIGRIYEIRFYRKKMPNARPWNCPMKNLVLCLKAVLLRTCR